MEGGVKTIEQAWALPELDNEFYEVSLETKPDGTVVQHMKVSAFCGRGISGDDIILFTDKDGRLMKVIQTESGPAKTELRL
jgi:hypothetical protein